MKRRVLCLALCLLLAAPLPARADGDAAVLSTQKLAVNGAEVTCEKYNIGGSNYFKLRDLAYLLNGTGSQFSVGWDAGGNTVSLRAGEPYTPDGTELEFGGADRSATAVRSRQTVTVNGAVRSDFSVYNIGGNNYFRLRDLGDALNFGVRFAPASNTARVYSKGTAKVTAFDALKEFVRGQGNDACGGNPAYLETVEAGAGTLEYRVIYDETLDRIVFSCVLPWSAEGYTGTHVASVGMYADAQAVGTAYEMYFDQHSEPYLSGSADVDPSTLGPGRDYSFASYEGAVPREQSERLARNMYVLALQFADRVLSGSVSPQGTSRMEVFGFTDLFALLN